MKINKEKIFEKFIDIKNMINIKIMICHKVLLSKSGLIHNIPFYSLIIVIIFHFFTIFIFYYAQKNILNIKIQNIIFGINNWKLVKEYEKEKAKLEKAILEEEKEKSEKKKN